LFILRFCPKFSRTGLFTGEVGKEEMVTTVFAAVKSEQQLKIQKSFLIVGKKLLKTLEKKTLS
jgi:hypothetical protein